MPSNGQALRDVDEWLAGFRRFWTPHLDALATEIARGKRQRRRKRNMIDVTTRSTPCGGLSATGRWRQGRRVSSRSASRMTPMPADLWDACTNIDRIPRWFLPITGDLRVGGHYRLEGNANGTILTCDPPREFTATWECGGDVSWIEVRITGEGSRPVTVRTATHLARRRPLGAVRPRRGRHGLRRRAGRSDHPSVDRRGRRPVVRSTVDGVRGRPPIHEAFRRGVVRGQRGRRVPTRHGQGPPRIGALPPTWEKTRTRSSQPGMPEISSIRCMPRHLSRSRG